jgi:hypothetical protein
MIYITITLKILGHTNLLESRPTKSSRILHRSDLLEIFFLFRASYIHL